MQWFLAINISDTRILRDGHVSIHKVLHLLSEKCIHSTYVHDSCEHLVKMKPKD